MAKNSKKTAPGRPFKPGKSGNPKGRPKLPEGLKEAFRAECQGSLDLLVDIRDQKDAKNQDRIKAAIAILDRGLGKPAQAVELTGPEGGPIETAVHVTPDPAFAASVLGELGAAGLTPEDGD